MMGQFAKELYDMKFLTSSHIDSEDSNRFSNNIALIKAVICAGLFPNVAIIK
jgi:ATP-dependent RNA helicase DHX36